MMTADMSTPSEFDAPRSVSRLAITSLILSLVFCCPLATLAGIVTGTIAVIFTMRDRTLSGRWMAILAIVISLTLTVVQVTVIYAGYQTVLVPVLTGPQSALKEGEAGNIGAFQSRFETTPTNGNTPENAKNFLDGVKERYGVFTGSALDQGSVPNKMPTAAKEFVGDYQLDFAKGRMRATCAIEIADPKGELSMKLKSILIHDTERGDISFPSTVEKSPEPSTNTKP